MANVLGNFLSSLMPRNNGAETNNISMLQQGSTGIEIYSGNYQEEYFGKLQLSYSGIICFYKNVQTIP